MSKSKYLLLCLLVFSLNSCSKKEIKPGYYLITEFNEMSTTGNWLSPQHGYLIVNKNNTLTFPFINETENRDSNNHIYTYSLTQNYITLEQGNFSKNYPYNVNDKNELTIKLKDGDLSLGMQLQQLDFNGNYMSIGFAKTKNYSWDEFNTNTPGIFGGTLLDFNNNTKKVWIKPELAHYLIKDSINLDYNYKVDGNLMVLQNEKNDFKITFFYDGILHLLPQDKYLSRIDLGALNIKI